LRKENEQLRMERETLKKAAFFARELGCEFHGHSATDSMSIRPLIPRPFGHPMGGGEWPWNSHADSSVDSKRLGLLLFRSWSDWVLDVGCCD